MARRFVGRIARANASEVTFRGGGNSVINRRFETSPPPLLPRDGSWAVKPNWGQNVGRMRQVQGIICQKDKRRSEGQEGTA